MSEPEKHPMLRWIESNEMSLEQLGEAAGCSVSHLRNLFAGRKEASLGLASRLSELTDGHVPMDAFLRPVADEARACS